MNTLHMTKVGEKDLRVTRRFNASPAAVFDAHVNEAKIKKWMLGPEGWDMPQCEVDGRPGGAFSYTWENVESRERFTISGTFDETDAPHRIVHRETMTSPEFTSPETLVVTEFAADGDGTLMTMIISYDSEETREGAVGTGMEEGMAVSYDNLEEMLA